MADDLIKADDVVVEPKDEDEGGGILKPIIHALIGGGITFLGLKFLGARKRRQLEEEEKARKKAAKKKAKKKAKKQKKQQQEQNAGQKPNGK